MKVFAGFFVFVVLVSAALSAKVINSRQYTPLSNYTPFTYTPGIYGPACGIAVLPQEVTMDEKALILSLHNQLRRFVAQGLEKRGNPGPQPPAANMRQMVWDEELARMAQSWANQCSFGHETYGRRIGQNLSKFSTTRSRARPDWTRTIQEWYNEVKFLEQRSVYSFPGKSWHGHVTGHYTQLIWADTSRIGCGAVSYWTREAPNWQHTLMVCNYGPPGNIVGWPVYKVGSPGSACPPGKIHSYGLCI